MFDNILVATDDSSLIKNGIRYTGNLFPSSNFHLLNVVNITEKSVPKTIRIMKELKESAKKAVDDGERILQSVGVNNINKVVKKGEPSEEILDYIDNNYIDLLVMGTHSKSGTQKFEIGDTSLKTLEHSSIPMLIFSSEIEPNIPKKIFNPTSGSKYSMEASYLAVELAEYFEGEISVMCIRGGDKEESTLRRVENFAKKYNIDLNITACTTRPEKDIVEESRKYDLVVVSRGRPGLKYKLRKIIPEYALGKLEREIIVETEKPLLFVGD